MIPGAGFSKIRRCEGIGWVSQGSCCTVGFTVNIRSTIFHGKNHYKWQFSIAMLNYQRVHDWSFAKVLCLLQHRQYAWRPPISYYYLLIFIDLLSTTRARSDVNYVNLCTEPQAVLGVSQVAYVAVTIERSLWKMAELPAPTAPPCCLRLSDPQENENFCAVERGVLNFSASRQWWSFSIFRCVGAEKNRNDKHW